MKLQINNLEALERLIGGDTILEMDIRQNIVEEFTRKHLKSLVNSDLMAKMEVAIKNEVNKELVSKFCPQGSYYDSFSLTPKATELIDGYIETAVSHKIGAIIEKYIESTKLNIIIEKRINDAANHITNYLADANLSRIIDAKVQAKLKEALGKL
jgi:hypothetical protein